MRLDLGVDEVVQLGGLSRYVSETGESARNGCRLTNSTPVGPPPTMQKFKRFLRSMSESVGWLACSKPESSAQLLTTMTSEESSLQSKILALIARASRTSFKKSAFSLTPGVLKAAKEGQDKSVTLAPR